MNPTLSEIENEIGKDLAANVAGLVYGTGTVADRNVFVGTLPEDVQECLMIVASASPPPHQYIDTEYLVIDFWSRSAHTDRSKALLRSVYELYHRRYAYDLGDWYVSFSQALGSIVDADRDAEGSKVYRLSVQFICRNTNHTS
jgi:hypothetical protein